MKDIGFFTINALVKSLSKIVRLLATVICTTSCVLKVTAMRFWQVPQEQPFKHTAPDRIKKFQFNLPPVREQRTIAYILGMLDDKIELNRQVNKTLEATARAIFKSWFIDFDPVKAKMEGNEPPFMDTETAALFPSAFQDSALGKIPKGWKVTTIDENFNLTMGQSPPGSTYNEDRKGMPFYQGAKRFRF